MKKVHITRIEQGLYKVNGKEVDTRISPWGKNLTPREHRHLLAYREMEREGIVSVASKNKRYTSSLKFGKYKGIPIWQFDNQKKTDYLYWLRGSMFWNKVDKATQTDINNFLNG